MGGVDEHCCAHLTETPARTSAWPEVSMNEPWGIRSRTGATSDRSAGAQSSAFRFRGFTSSRAFLGVRQSVGDQSDRMLTSARSGDSVVTLPNVHKHLIRMVLRLLQTNCSRTLEIY